VDVMERPSSKGKMPLDEATFQRLLAAAHVLQQHADQTKPPTSGPEQPAPVSEPGPSSLDQAAVLAEIVETQQQILMGKLDLVGAMSFVADRICKLTGARGAAVGLLHADKVVYRAGSGSAQGLIGLELQAEATVSAETLLRGKLLRCPRIDSEFRIDPQFARDRGIQSFIAVPLFREGHLAGVMELLFSKPDAFQEKDVRTSQLMAGLLSEALARDAEERWRKDVAQERASMLEALERIRPQLARLIDVPDAPADQPELKETELMPSDIPAATATPPDVPPLLSHAAVPHCSECGEPLGDEEFFCPSCGTARPENPDEEENQFAAALRSLDPALPDHTATAAPPPLPPVPSTATDHASARTDADVDAVQLPADLLAIADASPGEVPEPERPPAGTGPSPRHSVEAHELVPVAAEVVQSPPSSPGSYPWTSAKKAQQWLHSLAGPERRSALLQFWRNHGGDVSLGIAVALVLAAVLILSVSSHDSPAPGNAGNATAATSSTHPNASPVVRRKHRPPPPNLTLFEKLLVSMGLAEPPETPVYEGNPDVTVWVDLQTALYYCPGSNMYGKTPKGKLETQRDAQMDQFEPALRKVCE